MAMKCLSALGKHLQVHGYTQRNARVNVEMDNIKFMIDFQFSLNQNFPRFEPHLYTSTLIIY